MHYMTQKSSWLDPHEMITVMLYSLADFDLDLLLQCSFIEEHSKNETLLILLMKMLLGAANLKLV